MRWRGIRRRERFEGSGCDTHGLGVYTRVSNDERASYQFANGAGLGAGPGSASVGYLLGIRHTF